MRRLALLALAVAAPAQATEQRATELRFITCPIYRDADAGRKSGCWLADDPDGGQRYDVSQAPSKPDWNYQVLVEGRVAENAGNPCGGIVLDPARTSVLPERCPRHMLPAEGFPGRRFVLPERNVAPLSVARQVPPPPYPDRSFHLLYDFDRSFILYQLSDYLLDEAIAWIRAARPRRIVVTGHAATGRSLVSGRNIAERPAVARERAELVTEALVRLGVDRGQIETRWRSRSEPAPVPGSDGLAEPSRRRVDIEVLDATAGVEDGTPRMPGDRQGEGVRLPSPSMTNDSERRANGAKSRRSRGEGDAFADISLFSDLIGFRLRLATNVMTSDLRSALEGSGLRPVLFALLAVVARNPGIIQTAVGNALGVQRANLVPLVNELGKRGLIERRAAPNDRRAYALHLTPEGENLLDDVLHRIHDHEERLFGRLSMRERDTLKRLLAKVSAA